MHTLIVTDSAGKADGREILALLHKGWSCRAIAGQLDVSVPTVKARLMRLYRQAGRHRQSRTG